MKKIQKEVDDWVKQYKLGYFKPLEIMAQITEETGELAREINHRFGPKKKKETEDTKEIEEEIADIVFALVCLSNSLDLDMDRGFESTMKKLNSRDKDRWEKMD